MQVDFVQYRTPTVPVLSFLAGRQSWGPLPTSLPSDVGQGSKPGAPTCPGQGSKRGGSYVAVAVRTGALPRSLLGTEA